MTVVTTHTCQAGLWENLSNKFLKEFDELLQSTPVEEVIVIWGNLNRHIAFSRMGYERCHVSYIHDKNRKEKLYFIL